MKIHDVAQGSSDWFTLRAGIPTASEFGSIITPLLKVRTGEDVTAYLARKLAEKWLGRALHTFSGGAAEQGSMREEDARNALEAIFGRDIKQVGFITSDDGEMGCSPDGMFDDGTGVEFKSPQPEAHCRYLMNGTLPKEYFCQVHGSMLVTGAPHWLFMSFNPSFPSLRVVVDRDEKVMDAMRGALAVFIARLDTEHTKICELNGGKPQRSRQ